MKPGSWLTVNVVRSVWFAEVVGDNNYRLIAVKLQQSVDRNLTIGETPAGRDTEFRHWLGVSVFQTYLLKRRDDDSLD